MNLMLGSIDVLLPAHGSMGSFDEILFIAIVGVTIGVILWLVIKPEDEEDESVKDEG